MAMTLASISQPARTLLHGASTEIVPGGRKLKIDIPSVASVFDDGPPAGKQWQVIIDVTIEEIDS